MAALKVILLSCLRLSAFHRLVILCIGMLVNISSPDASAQSSTLVKIDMESSSQRWQPIPEGFFGVHYPILTAGSANRQPAAVDKMGEVLRRLNVDFVRFPAGTKANEWIPFGPGNEEREGDGPISAAMRVAKHLTGGGKWVWVINPSLKADEIMKFLKKLYASNINVVAIEIGNELYEPKYRKEFENTSEYIDYLKQIVPPIKKAWPSIEIGVPVADPRLPSPWRRSGIWESRLLSKNVGVSRLVRWNSELAAAPKGLFDAVIIHPYIPLTEQSQLSRDNLMAYLFSFAAAEQEVIGQEIGRMFPGRDVWATEYGILNHLALDGANPKEKSRWQFGKSEAFAVVNADQTLRFLEAGATRVSTHDLHNSQGFGLVQFNQRNEVINLPRYWILSELGRLMKEYEQFAPLRLTGDSVLKTNIRHQRVKSVIEEGDARYESVSAWCFGKGSRCKEIVIINRSREPITVALKDGGELSRTWSFGSGQGLISAADEMIDWTNIPKQLATPDLSNYYGNQVKVEGWSMAILVPGRNACAPAE